jgi:hypothetical protein
MAGRRVSQGVEVGEGPRVLGPISSSSKVPDVFPRRHQPRVQGNYPSKRVQRLGPGVPADGTLVKEYVGVEKPPWPVLGVSFYHSSVGVDLHLRRPIREEETFRQRSLSLGQ